MSDKQEYSNQHYIPQCYLKHFSSGSKSLYYKDCNTSPSKTRDIKCVGCEDDLYAIQTKRVGRHIYLEKHLSKEVENKYSVLLNEITKSGKRALINKFPDEVVLLEDKKFLFAAFISIQYIRMPMFKEYFVKLADASAPILSVFGAKYAEKKGSDIILNTYPDVSPSLLHANFGYNNLDILTKYAQKLYDNYWEFLFTDSKKVCTSNNPIYFEDSIITNDVIPFFEGDVAKFCALSTCYEDWVKLPYDNLMNFDTYLGFPISRNIYLRIWNRANYPEKCAIDNRFFRMSDELLTEFNNKTFRNSTEIYSSQPFEIIFPNDI